MKRIPLTRGMFAMVDDEDYDRVAQFKWYATRGGHTFYAAREVRHITQRMHRVILNAPAGMDVHHKNGDGLDNRKENIAILSRRDHQKSKRRASPHNHSGFRGVHFCKRSKKFAAGIQIHVGFFSSPEEAARARDAKARELGWPEEGMNFPTTEPVSLCSGATCQIPDWHHW